MAILLLLALWKVEIVPKSFKTDYLSADSTLGIKGICILLVFFSHFVAYIDLSNPTMANLPYLKIRGFLGQMIVVPFLFYSGFGIAESIRKKGQRYVKQMPYKRILMVLFQFDVAIVLFWVLKSLMGNQYTLKHMLLTFIGWNGIGNSNWYIFAILFLYAATWISALVFENGMKPMAISITWMTVMFILIMSRYKDPYWYNTALTYAAGFWYSIYKPQIDTFFQKSNKIYWWGLFMAFASFCLLHKYWSSDAVYELVSIFFALSVALLTMKVNVRNRFLKYCGKHLFSLFILQRLPMIVLKDTAIAGNMYLYFAVSFIITLGISAVFDRVVPPFYNGIIAKLETNKWLENLRHTAKKQQREFENV